MAEMGSSTQITSLLYSDANEYLNVEVSVHKDVFWF